MRARHLLLSFPVCLPLIRRVTGRFPFLRYHRGGGKASFDDGLPMFDAMVIGGLGAQRFRANAYSLKSYMEASSTFTLYSWG